VTGTAGSFVIESPMGGRQEALVLGRSPATEGEDWGREPEAAWGRLWCGDECEVIPSERGGRWDQFYEEFARAVQGAGPVPVDPWDVVATTLVLDTLRRSATEPRSLEVPAVTPEDRGW